MKRRTLNFFYIILFVFVGLFSFSAVRAAQKTFVQVESVAENTTTNLFIRRTNRRVDVFQGSRNLNLRLRTRNKTVFRNGFRIVIYQLDSEGERTVITTVSSTFRRRKKQLFANIKLFAPLEYLISDPTLFFEVQDVFGNAVDTFTQKFTLLNNDSSGDDAGVRDLSLLDDADCDNDGTFGECELEYVANNIAFYTVRNNHPTSEVVRLPNGTFMIRNGVPPKSQTVEQTLSSIYDGTFVASIAQQEAGQTGQDEPIIGVIANDGSNVDDDSSGGSTINLPLNLVQAPTGDVDMNEFKIINLADPVNGQDAATKAYVDAAIAANPSTTIINSSGGGGGLSTSDVNSLISSALTTPNSNISTLQSDVAALQANGANASWEIVTGNGTTLEVNKKYLVDTTSTDFAISLPGSPSNGDELLFMDGADFSVNNLTLENGATQTIHGTSEDLILDMKDAKVRLVYYGGDWRIARELGL